MNGKGGLMFTGVGLGGDGVAFQTVTPGCINISCNVETYFEWHWPLKLKVMQQLWVGAWRFLVSKNISIFL